jgi:uncharacterized CHY-type Zn-finger protein
MSKEPYTGGSSKSLETRTMIKENAIYDCFQLAIQSHCGDDVTSCSETHDANTKRPWNEIEDQGSESTSICHPNKKKIQFDDTDRIVQIKNCNGLTQDEIELINCEAEKIKSWKPSLLKRLPSWASNPTSLQPP